MRDTDVLSPLLAPVETLPGTGPALGRLLRRATGGGQILDLLYHLPETITDRRFRPCVEAAESGRIATFGGIIVRITPPAKTRQPFRAVLSDGTGECDLTFFSKWQAKSLRVGAPFVVSGRMESFAGRPGITNPDYLLPGSDTGRIPLLDAVWPLTAGLFTGQLRRILREALARVPDLPEWHPDHVLTMGHWPDFRTALAWMHFPGDLLPSYPDWEAVRARAHERLSCDELLAGQIALRRARAAMRDMPGRRLAGSGDMRREALSRFGHEPTPAQQRVTEEIAADLRSGYRMTRLLQGDVGAGKTLVALMAMLNAAECGAQAAIMAPTEILARQHYATFRRLSPAPVVFLSGSVRGKARKEALAAIADGSARLIVGTHALVQEKVVFHDLALAIVDEQHRFGVEQRLELSAKGDWPHMLVMTATPIPRTLLLTRWGQLEVSRLDGKPVGRKPVRTSLHSLSSLEQVVSGVGRALKSGAQIFWVCPLVSESTELEIAAAEARFETLRERFGDRTGLAHGQQTPEEREAAIAAFAKGETSLLVATTVIEVGVDVPSATIMVIEHAERFGLAQLHQLRGRVGRGADESFCLLLHEPDLSQSARQRLTLLRDSEDGFRIADEDFRQRGGGDLTGRRQAGVPGFRLVRFEDLERLSGIARQEMTGPIRGEDMLLKLFGKENAGHAFGAS
ncbi:ATP-dependent DNA helicase RecG [Acetobacter sp. AN02]|uniref:ATP-dependent DNA helicase RecG n=1 Tax=Acetobacter sp. AN02 TaxID=2894186 RepID=UPI0024345772|nr:ATP-dependent DNA helicase RecG [Acetobacter sp. AN02]MDG6093951.1 ATP-dependent DNA helicase RecG [Acetobacter sp. AN02]